MISTTEHGSKHSIYLFERPVSVNDVRLVNFMETFWNDGEPMDNIIFYTCRVPLPGIRGWTFDKDRKSRPIRSFGTLELATYRNTIREQRLALMDGGADEEDIPTA